MRVYSVNKGVNKGDNKTVNKTYSKGKSISDNGISVKLLTTLLTGMMKQQGDDVE